MPNYPRRYRKKRNGKYLKKRRNYSPVSVSNNMGPLSVRIKAKHIYSDSYQLDPAVSGIGLQCFSANGIYDCDVSGVGHQARGFDELSALYDHYVVISTKLTAWANNIDTTNPALIGLMVRDQSASVTDKTALMENRYVRIQPLADGSGSEPKKISITVNPNKFLGRSHPLSNPDLKGDITHNPTEQCYIQLYGIANSPNDQGNINVTVRIEYTVIWIEPKNLAES